MPIYLTYFIQLLLIVHVLKTGRERMWIFILLFLPLIGGAAYLVMEVLPGLMGGVSGQRARRGVQQLIDPGGDERDCARAWEQSANADNGRRYAQALITAGKTEKALKILDQARDGFFRNDPTLLLLQAQAQFLNENWPETLDALERLKQENPEFSSAEGHLLRARAMESAGRGEEAIAEYRDVVDYFPGAEARYRLAIAFQTQDMIDAAKMEFEGLLRDADLAPAHYRKSQKIWLKASKEALKTKP